MRGFMVTNYIRNEYADLLNSDPAIHNLFNSMVEDFSFSMRELSHELGNIVTLINSSLQIIESSHPEVKSYKYWNSTTEDVKYMIELLSKLSSFNNGAKLNSEPTDIIQILDNIISSFITNDCYSDINFISDMDADIPLITLDPTKLKQVFINIIKNACEAGSQNINIQLNHDDTNILITITDDGYGLSPEQTTQIFKPMVTFKENGTGLGLPICERIISAHQGQIYCNSEIGVGTSFTIILPI